MAVFDEHQNVIMGAAGAGGADLGDPIENSIRLNDDDSAHTAKTFSTGSAQTTFCASAWVKRGNLGLFAPAIMGSYKDSNNLCMVYFNSSNNLVVICKSAGAFSTNMTTSTVFRDTHGWYHVYFQVDSTTGDSSVWVNNVEQPLQGPTKNNTSDTYTFGENVQHWVGRINNGAGSNYYFDGEIAECHLVIGSTLSPESFGRYSASHPNVWVPITPSGITYGSNGFHLDFAVAPGTGNGAGTDVSGNGNHFTDSGLTADDQLSDTPTDNLTTLSPLSPNAGTLSNGNKVHSGGSSWARSTLAIPVAGGGIWYFETVTTFTGGFAFGFIGSDNGEADPTGGGTDIVTYVDNNRKNVDGTVSSYGSGFSSGHRIGCELDLDNNEVRFYNNAGTSLGTISKTWTSPAVQFVVRTNTDTIVCDFDDADWSHTPTAGALALRQANLPNVVTDLGGADLPNEHFNTVLWQGNATIRSITGVGFQPDLLWIKDRDNASNFSNSITDAVRGVTKHIYTDSTRAELTSTGSQDITSFDSDGFSLAAVNTNIVHNGSGVNHVGWNFLANGAGAGNSDGTISSTVSVSPTGAWSIGTFTGTGAAGTVGHGLPGAPECFIIKNTGAAESWPVYHNGIASDAETDVLFLNNSSAASDSAVYWNDTAPASSVFTVSTDNSVNASGATMFFIAFRSVPGICKVGSHIGNGSADGPYIDCGFAPAFIMSKSVGVGSWIMLDRARPGYNPTGNYLYADLTNAEAGVGGEYIDMLSSGIKIRTTGAGINSSSVKYIDLIIAESAIGGGIPFPNAR